MSIRGKDVRTEIDPDMHDRLRRMADYRNVDVARLSAELLEKMIAAEWHAFSLMLERLGRSGIARQDADSRGRAR